MRELESIQEKIISSPKLKLKRLGRGIFQIENAILAVAFLIIALFVTFAIIPQWVAPYSPTHMFPNAILQPPSLQYFFGTDYFGRDVFSLIVYGSKTSLLLGISAVAVGGMVGALIGIMAGYLGGIVDVVFMRIIEIIQTIPGVLLALALAAALGSSFFNLVIAISIAAIPAYARVMRGQILSIKNRPYILAAKSIGTSNTMIFLKHVLPNAYSPLLVMGSNGLGTAILTGAGLSFLGLGVVSDIPDWGFLLSQGRNYIAAGWWISTFPGLAIALFVLAVNIFGDSLRDILDPKKRLS